MSKKRIILTSSSRFEAARSINIYPKNYKQHNLHGHSFLGSWLQTVENDENLNGLENFELTRNLKTIIKQLNYTHLNKKIKDPTDENIAQWIKQSIGKKPIYAIGVQSTSNQGVYLYQASKKIHTWKRFHFEAAHKLPFVAKGHKCGRMHGHSFKVIIHFHENISSKSRLLDYEDMEKIWSPIDKLLNYRCLNDIEGLSNPTSELISRWIWKKMVDHFSPPSFISIYETDSCGAHYDGKNFVIWKDFTIDSAVRIDTVNSRLSNIHGHTFLIRLKLSAPLDKILGWTKDFGDVKVLFDPIFKSVDHQPLYEKSEIFNSSNINIANWLFEATKKILPELSGIELYEMEGCGVIINNGKDDFIMPVSEN